jgi:WD40 repeat protein
VVAIGMTAFAAIASREHHAVENERNAAVSRLVADESHTLQSSDPALAMQLALVAYRLSQTTEARSALLDATTGEMPTRLSGRPGRTELALGDDGHRLAIARQGDDTVTIYGVRYSQLTQLAVLPDAGRPGQVTAVALSDDGRLLACGDSTGHVTLWGLGTVSRPRRLAVLRAGAGAVGGLSFSPRAAALAAADRSGRVQRWSLASPAQPALAAPLSAPGGTALEAVSYSHDGRTLAAVGAHGTLLVWPAHGGTAPLESTTTGGATLSAVSYSPDGHTLATGGRDGQVELWTLAANGRPARASSTLSAHGGIEALAFSRDGRYLAAGALGKSAPVWQSSHWQQVASLPHPAGVSGVAFTDGDRRLLTTDATGTALVWQFPAPSTYTFASALTGVSFAAATPRLTVTLRSGRADSWNVADEWRPAPWGAWYAATATTPPATTVTTAPATTATRPSPATGATPAINPHAGDGALARTRAQTSVVGSALSANGQLFAAAGSDHLVWLWDVSDPASPQLLAKLGGFTGTVTGVAFSGNGQTLFTGGTDHTVRIWNLSRPTQPKQLPNSPLLGPSTAITRLALSPDNRTLAVATIGGRVWLWSVATPAKARLSADLIAARGRLTALAFSPSDNLLVAGGSNRRLIFWHYRPFEVINRICALAGTAITRGEWELWVQGAAYKPPCAGWRPPAPRTSAAR